MTTHDQAPAVIQPSKRPYQTPQVTELGDVRALTQNSGSAPDMHKGKK